MIVSKAKTDIKRWGITLVASFAIAFLIEICIFNYQSLETAFLHPNNTSIGEQSTDAVILHFPNSNAEFFPVNGEVTTLTLTTDSDIPILLDIAGKDEGNQFFYSLGNTTINGSKTIRINPSGKITSLQITTIEDESFNGSIKVEVNKPIPFDIKKSHVLAIAAITLITFGVSSSSSLARRRYDESKSFSAAVGVVAALGIFGLCSASIISPDAPGYEHYHEYYELTQALAAGQTSLLVKPSPELLALDNPYDTTARIASGAPYLWDHALFNERYYVYFGVLPAVIYYLPFYAVTGGAELPNWVAIGISYALSAIGMAFLVFNCCKKWFPGTKQASFLLGFITLLLGSWAIPCAQFPDLYNIPISLGLACAIWGIAFLIKAITPRKASLLNACLGTTFLSLTILCRPQMLVFGIVAIALAAFSLRDPKTRKANAKVIGIAFLPIIVITAVAGAYNYSRFGSPLDFGANYNLTTNDMTHRGWNADRLPLAFFAYLVEPFAFSLSKMAFNSVNLDYTYFGTTISQPMHGGILALIPVLPCAILFFLLTPQKARQNEPLQLVAVLILCTLITVAFDANGAGILMRYFADFGPLLSFAACLSMLTLLNNNATTNQPMQASIAFGAQTAIRRTLIISVLVSIALQLIELGAFRVGQ